MEISTITPLIDASAVEVYDFGKVLNLASSFSSTDEMLGYFSLLTKSDTLPIGLVSYYQGLYQEWQTLGSPVLEASNWSEFQSYVSAHPYQGN